MTTNTSLNYYSSRNPLNARIAENMLDVTSMQEGFYNFERKACFCFLKAYEICKELIEESPVSVWKVPDYYNSATFLYYQGDLSTIMKAVTISIVLILSEHFDEKWRQDNLKFLEKLKDGLNNLQLSDEKNEAAFHKSIMRVKGIKSACINAYETLRRGTDIDYIIPFEEFSTKNINDTRVSVSGENNMSREELMKAIEDAVKDAFHKHKKEIDEKEIAKEDIKKSWEQALANAKAEIESKIPRFEYDEKNEGLKIIKGPDKHNNGKNESLEEIIKSTVKKYLDEEIEASEADIDEIFADVYGKDLVDKVNREMSAANNVEESNEQTNQLPIPNTDDNLRHQLADAQKTIDEQAKTIEKLQAEVENMKSSNSVNIDMDVDYDDVNKWAKVIFFATVLNAAYQKKFTVGQQLALFICLICGGKPSTYQPLISKIASMEDNEKDKSGHSYSPQVIKAAREIVKRMIEIPEGEDVHPTIQGYINSICDEFGIEKPKKKDH